jgi:hypothetical protein
LTAGRGPLYSADMPTMTHEKPLTAAERRARKAEFYRLVDPIRWDPRVKGNLHEIYRRLKAATRLMESR